MYCVKCGVELQPGAERCPLCGTRVFHLDIVEQPESAPYPRASVGEEAVSHGGLLFILSFLFLIPAALCLLIDGKLSGGVSWSGYVCLGLAALYIALCVPLWFKQPNPVVFFPIAAASALGLTLYICLKTGGRWFLPFAFPVGGALALILETVIVLLRYAVGGVRHRILFVVGGAVIAAGGLCLLIEFLMKLSFALPMRWWSLYPLTALTLLGVMLIVIGACPPLRESLYKKFFI
ncbi:MAG: zinc ribbon domain-containing protein [Oscillospiraceae bacterium]|nr:zinc ribbon domain-containing protein [Oscillospiraceae bacterium]